MRVKNRKPELSPFCVNESNIDAVISGILKLDIEPAYLIIDLFCGAGGTSTGFEMSNGIAHVIACVNHDYLAIKSHWANYPHIAHFEEDIRTLNLSSLIKLLAHYRRLYPNAKVILWASLECTNFSKAKGGQPRDADSRTLADHLERYVTAVNPDYIQIENVVEFMSWGPLDNNGKPISRKNGSDWLRWRREICALGYHDDWREMNSADFGAYTSRNRLFGIFAKHGLPVSWPQPTHGKIKKRSVPGGLFDIVRKPWNPVKDVLDFSDEGKSIFERPKPLSDKTLERIYAGLVKYVAGVKDNFLAKIYAVSSKSSCTYNTDGPAHTVITRDAHEIIQTSFLSKYFSGKPDGKNISVDGPAGTIKCIDGHALVRASFLSRYNGGKPDSRNTSIEEPARTITTENRHAFINAHFIAQRNGGNPESRVVGVDEPARTLTSTAGNQDLVSPNFLSSYYGNGGVSSTNQPSPTLTTKDRLAIINTHFIERSFSSGRHNHSSVNNPIGALLPIPKSNLVTVNPFVMSTNYDNKPNGIEEPLSTITANRKWHYLVNPSWIGNTGSTEVPCPVIVARQDKSPLYLVESIGSQNEIVAIRIDENDSDCMIRIKEFMIIYSIVDIKMRMLKVAELLKIQGFPDGYILEGSQADQKKFIGNSVVPNVVTAWIIAMGANHNNNSKAA